MYSISIALKRAQTPPIVLLYRQEDEFSKAKIKIASGDGSITDDFGTEVLVTHADIAALVFEDMDQTRLAYIERMMYQGISQSMLQKRAATDPQISRSGGAILHPMGTPRPGNGLM